MKTFAEYETEGYSGIDASLDISLFEYGLIWKKEDKEYRFVYGVGSEGNYNSFDWGSMSQKDYDDLLNEDWFDIKAVCLYNGIDEKTLRADFPNSIYSLLQFHGYENIFGTAYFPFKIKDPSDD